MSKGESRGGRFALLIARWAHLARAATIVSGGTVAANALSFLQEVLIARKYGRSAQLDGYLFALSLLVFISQILGVSFGASLVPVYANAQSRVGTNAAQRALSSASAMALAWFTVLTALLVASAPITIPALAPKFAPWLVHVAIVSFAVLAPSLIATAFSQAWGGVLNIGGKLAVVAVSPAARPLCVIVAILMTSMQAPVAVIAAGLTTGYLLEALLVGASLRRHGVSIRPRWMGMTDDIRTTRHQYFAISLVSTLTSTLGVTDQIVASRLTPGSIATLNYGQKLTGPVVAIALAATLGILFPRFADAAARRDAANLRRRLSLSLLIAIVGSAVCAAIFIVFATPIVRLAFQRGAFGNQDVPAVASVLRVAALLLIPVVASAVVARFLIAVQAYNRTWVGFLVYPFLNLALDVVFARWWGVNGIVWSSIVVACYGFAHQYLLAWRVISEIAAGPRAALGAERSS